MYVVSNRLLERSRADDLFCTRSEVGRGDGPLQFSAVHQPSTAFGHSCAALQTTSLPSAVYLELTLSHSGVAQCAYALSFSVRSDQQ